jgi:hypothetical protein
VSAASRREHGEEIAFELQLFARLRERAAIDQEHVLDPLAEREDLGGLHVDAVLGKYARDCIQQADAIGRRDRQQIVLATLVGLKCDRG